MDSDEDKLPPEEQPVPRFGIEAKDTIEKSKPKQQPLLEKDFIHDEVKANPSPLLLWLAVLGIVCVVFWGVRSWFSKEISQQIVGNPFMQVTNREMSLFLWQNSNLMRINQKGKAGYLPAFNYYGDVSLNPEQAELYAVAPPEVIFRYHLWARLLKDEFTPTPIPAGEFHKFLEEEVEWSPKYWKQAPQNYAEFLKTVPAEGTKDISNSAIPKDVQMAFQGWKNYYLQGDQINNYHPTLGQVQAFLKAHPHYARNYWRNIVSDVSPDYLKMIAQGQEMKADAPIPDSQLAPFLKVALFNQQFNAQSQR